MSGQRQSPSVANTKNSQQQQQTTDAELTRLNVDYRKLQHREDALRNLLLRVRREETCLQRAIDVCTVSNSKTAAAAATTTTTAAAATTTLHSEEERALQRLHQALFVDDDDNEDDDDGDGDADGSKRLRV